MSDIRDKVVGRAVELLESGRIAGFLGIRCQGEQYAPYLFTKAEELKDLSLGDRNQAGDCRYPLVKVLFDLAERFPSETFGLMARGCDERALMQLINEDRTCPLRRDRVVVVGFSCPEDLAKRCQCQKPWPDEMTAGEKTAAVCVSDLGEGLADEMERWLEITQTCIKCMGCKTICPVCVCKECTVEEEALVPQRQLPPSPNFLITRAVHMVGRCVYCGLCESTCPAGIPLKQLYKMIARVLGQDSLVPAAPILESASPEAEALQQ